jgi:hypothetical protein
MDKTRGARRPRRSWAAIALVLGTLAVVQACGQSGNRTGPTATGSPTALQLKLRRAGGAELPAGCTSGTFSVIGPGVNIQDAPLPADGKIAVSLTIGLTYTFSVEVNCGSFGILNGSKTITVLPGGTSEVIEITITQILGVQCVPSTVAPGQASRCTCNAKFLTAPTFQWKGVNSTGPTATFSSQTPGVYQISCSINGGDPKSTTVEVKAPEPPPEPAPPPPRTGAVRVTNTAQSTCCDLDATFSPATVAPIPNLAPGRSVQRNNVAPGNYSASGCFGIIPFQVQAGQTTNLDIDGNVCG